MTEMSKLKLQTSHSLKLLTEQIMALENQSTRLIETVKDLLNDKIFLEDALVKQQMKTQILEAKIDKIKKSDDIEKLLFENQLMKNQCPQKCDRDCQTEKAHLHATEAGPRLNMFDVNSESLGPLRNTQVKSKHDLDEPTLEGILLRELFFKHPSIDENEGLVLFPRLPRH
ncbi:uncharacterized protein LOC105684748 [Athalia rosae]|uniref:uncharacterized protein LOC105684748 n=1 Tax=Athalia rosae TaxID=37344 RepID=UPI0020338220|nr:uncharacterized protein LOC105684748 [Athalia rosae]